MGLEFTIPFSFTGKRRPGVEWDYGVSITSTNTPEATNGVTVAAPQTIRNRARESGLALAPPPFPEQSYAFNFLQPSRRHFNYDATRS